MSRRKVTLRLEEEQGYGFFHGGDPRNFCPSGFGEGEENTPEEVAAHRAACDEWDKAEAEGRVLRDEDGCCRHIAPGIVLTVARFGMGVYTLRYPTPFSEAWQPRDSARPPRKLKKRLKAAEAAEVQP